MKTTAFGIIVAAGLATVTTASLFAQWIKYPTAGIPRTSDGRPVGRWDGDAFVVTSAGSNDDVWFDNAGRPATAQLRVTERFVRRDFGRMDIEITIDDRKAYTRPWTVTQPLVFQPDTELLEYICDENNKYFQIIPGARPNR